mgnify:CR=1 FL=1
MHLFLLRSDCFVFRHFSNLTLNNRIFYDIIIKTMNNPKTISAILILGLAFIASYFIYDKGKSAVLETNKNTQEKSLQKPSSLLSNNLDNNSKPLKNRQSEENVNGGNITQNLSLSFFDELKSKVNLNQDPEVLSNGIESASGEIFVKVLESARKDFEFFNDVSDSVLKISNDNSKETKISYLKNIDEITKKNFKGFDKVYLEVIVDTYQKTDSSSASQLAEIYKNMANDYLNLSIPSEFVDFHKNAVVYYKNAEKIYLAMANYKNDPIKGYMALEVINGLLDSGYEIQNSAIEMAKQIQ